MTDDENLPSKYQHTPEAQWTVGDLRRSLDGVDDDLRIQVLVPGQPLGDIMAHMVVCDGQVEDVDNLDLAAEKGVPRRWFEIYVDFPAGIYRLDVASIFEDDPPGPE